ncbi:MAG: hypothetical protein RI907_1684 [Pseudomonadota bacterium]|jgi:hypothetical protein
MHSLRLSSLALAASLPFSAHAAVTTGATDLITGLQWAHAASLAEGAEQGYRAATTAEFTTFLRDAGMRVNLGTQDAWVTGPGSFGMPMDAFGYSQLGSVRFQNASGASVFGFSPQRELTGTGMGSTPVGVHFGWLDGQTDTLVGLGHYENFWTPTCDPGMLCAAVVGVTPMFFAGWGTFESMAAGGHSPVFNHNGETPWLLGLRQMPDANFGYYMVKASAVPEPTTGLSLALGLIALAGLARARQPH